MTPWASADVSRAGLTLRADATTPHCPLSYNPRFTLSAEVLGADEPLEARTRSTVSTIRPGGDRIIDYRVILRICPSDPIARHPCLAG